MHGSHLLVSAALVVAAPLPLNAATSYDNYVDLQLVLAVDVSGSMDYYEQQVQRDGYVQAFRDPEVVSAITSGPYGRIAVTYVHWAGAFFQQAIVPWTVIGSKDDASAFAALLSKAPYDSQRGTSISSGLLYAASAFDVSNVESDRRTIDISGDGSNNDGTALVPVRDRLVRQGITINGLPILVNPSPVPGALFATGLDDYYHDCVIGGPTSFVVPIKTLQGFGPAIRRKLILEIAALPPSSLLTPVAGTPTVDCAAAERNRINSFIP
jgi:hypothetical protein